MTDFFAEQRKNKIKTAILISVFILLLICLGYLFDTFLGYYFRIRTFPIATLAAFCVGVVQSFIGYYRGGKIVLGSLMARLADPSDLKELTAINVVRELSIAGGIPAPKVYIIPDNDPNAMATGRDPYHSYIGLTKGLINLMNREELQGVVAHELAHIKNYDTLLMTMVSALMGSIILISDWFKHTILISSESKDKKRKIKIGGGAGILFLIGAIVFLVIAPVLARLLALSISRTREYFADSKAVQLTRNPLGLASALKKIASHSGPIELAKDGTAHLFITDPLRRKLSEKEGLFADLFSTHPPIEKRIAILERMAHIRK